MTIYHLFIICYTNNIPVINQSKIFHTEGHKNFNVIALCNFLWLPILRDKPFDFFVEGAGRFLKKKCEPKNLRKKMWAKKFQRRKKMTICETKMLRKKLWAWWLISWGLTIFGIIKKMCKMPWGGIFLCNSMAKKCGKNSEIWLLPCLFPQIKWSISNFWIIYISSSAVCKGSVMTQI